jgi:hypothetical protein
MEARLSAESDRVLSSALLAGAGAQMRLDGGIAKHNML